MAVSVMAFSFAVADKLAQSSQGWFGPLIFLVINCVGLFCAYKFIIWYSKKVRAVRSDKEDKEIASLIRNKKGK
tara:strand:+ start:303 stop:524 length:222 start_codon:yes stop_codon:yes gene_type:complete